MKYSKSMSVQGGWVKAADIVSGTKAKLVSETVPQESVYEGKPRTQNIAKVRFQGEEGEPKNINLNRTTINGLIDAFGDDSNDWTNKLLTAHTEKTVIAGKRVTVLYLIPEGFELGEDANGYLVIQRIGASAPTEKAPVEYPNADDEGIDVADIPF